MLSQPEQVVKRLFNMIEIKENKAYKTKGGFKVFITSVDENHTRPYLGSLFHSLGRKVISYYHNQTTGDSDLDIICEWDDSVLPIYYHKEVPFNKDYREAPTNIENIKDAIEANKNLWFVDKDGNKYQGSKTWQDILNYRLTGKFEDENLFNYK
jgi:hypothetical protein